MLVYSLYYAGVGYFSLPLLVHGRARLVHCCEWNQYAVEGLKRGLHANGVGDCCIIHIGDNREVSTNLIYFTFVGIIR